MHHQDQIQSTYHHLAKSSSSIFNIQYSIFECTVCRVHTRAKLPHAALSNCNLIMGGCVVVGEGVGRES